MDKRVDFYIKFKRTVWCMSDWKRNRLALDRINNENDIVVFISRTTIKSDKFSDKTPRISYSFLTIYKVCTIVNSPLNSSWYFYFAYKRSVLEIKRFRASTMCCLRETVWWSSDKGPESTVVVYIVSFTLYSPISFLDICIYNIYI